MYMIEQNYMVTNNCILTFVHRIVSYGKCNCYQFSLTIFILHQLRNKFLQLILIHLILLPGDYAEPHSSFGSTVDLRTGGCWFDPWLVQYSFQGLMIVIATGFIPLSLLSVVSTVVMWESSQWHGKNIVQSTC